MQWLKTFLTVFAAGLILVGCENRSINQEPSTQLSIGLITGLGGVTEPCGCTSKPLGGLDRMAGLVSEKARGNAFGLMFVGNTFYELDNPPGHLVQQEHEKARAIAQVLEKLKPFAVLPGGRDMQVGTERVPEFTQSFSLPILSGLRGPSQQRFKADSALRTIVGHKVGVIGIAGDDSAGQANAYTQGALALRRQGAVVVIALIGPGGSEGEALAAEIDGVERPPASAPTASTRAPTAAEPVATTPNAASSPSATLPGALAEAVGGSQSDDEAEAAYGAHAQFWVEDDADPEGHYYASQGASAPAPTAQFTRTVRKQWQLLQAGLPRGIHVAAYAGRVDLLRALVLGPPATPYVDAVFVFDIQLPPDFPQQPPSVHYVSHGERVNPNLYENGKVCLSLLGTWTGRQSCELWNPEESTVLQVRRPRRS